MHFSTYICSCSSNRFILKNWLHSVFYLNSPSSHEKLESLLPSWSCLVQMRPDRNILACVWVVTTPTHWPITIITNEDKSWQHILCDSKGQIPIPTYWPSLADPGARQPSKLRRRVWGLSWSWWRKQGWILVKMCDIVSELLKVLSHRNAYLNHFCFYFSLFGPSGCKNTILLRSYYTYKMC